MKTLARLDDKFEILRRINQVRPQSPPLWGHMSARQMICHLADSYRMAAGRKDVSDATSVLQRTVVKWTALYAPIRWPRGRLATRPEIDQSCGGTRPSEFADDVAALVQLVELISERPGTLEGRVHPIFGRMSQAAWLRWAYLHSDHHLRQFGA
jgi:hypothetical protein